MNGGASLPGTAKTGPPIVRIGEVESTNDVARVLALAGVPEGAVVVARRQTRGRGRWGRAWAAPPGGVWCSVLLRPTATHPWGLLSLAVAVGAAEAIEKTTGVKTGIRWPNDLVVDGRKVAGVLLEGAGDAVIVGIGINANVPLDALPEDVAPRATSLHLATGQPVDSDGLREAVVGRLMHWYRIWSAGGRGTTEAWRRRDVSRGTRVTAGSPGRTVEGIAEGIDGDGALLLRLASGEIRRVLTGDLIPASGARGAD